MVVEFLPDQLNNWVSTAPRPYTSSPLELVWIDILLFFRLFWALPNIVVPLWPTPSGALDELSFTAKNLLDIGIHVLLICMQLIFLVSLPFCIVVPLGWVALYVAGFLLMNAAICRVLNGSKPSLTSKTNLEHFPKHDDERWIFLNGVAVG
jgi:hypothetical protein